MFFRGEYEGLMGVKLWSERVISDFEIRVLKFLIFKKFLVFKNTKIGHEV